jgi:hypothetical protein
MLKILLNIAIILSLVGQLFMPSYAMSNGMTNEMTMSTEMTMSGSQSSNLHPSTMIDIDCDNYDHNDNCCSDNISQCISHCHAIAHAFMLFSGEEFTAIRLTGAKVSLALWVSTPTTLTSQNPPPIA